MVHLWSNDFVAPKLWTWTGPCCGLLWGSKILLRTRNIFFQVIILSFFATALQIFWACKLEQKKIIHRSGGRERAHARAIPVMTNMLKKGASPQIWVKSPIYVSPNLSLVEIKASRIWPETHREYFDRKPKPSRFSLRVNVSPWFRLSFYRRGIMSPDGGNKKVGHTCPTFSNTFLLSLLVWFANRCERCEREWEHERLR